MLHAYHTVNKRGEIELDVNNEIHVNKIPPAIELVVEDYYIVKYIFNGSKGTKIIKDCVMFLIFLFEHMQTN